jgi:P-type Cu+ transporter
MSETTSTPTATQERIDLEVTGMTCASCAARIEKKLNRLDGVTATVNYATDKATVELDPAHGVSPDELVVVVEGLGYGASLPRPEPAARPDSHDGRTAGPAGGEHDHTEPLEQARHRLLVTAALSLPVIVLSMVPAWQFDSWQWLAFTLTSPGWCGAPGRSTGPPGPTSATAPPPWTRSSAWACWPPTAGPPTASSGAMPG